jgi:hypothetical protein
MRRETVVIIIVVLSLIPNLKVQSQTNEKCLKMIWPNDYHQVWNEEWKKWDDVGSINPDSIMVDTCKDSPTYGKMFCKRFFTIQFLKQQS